MGEDLEDGSVSASPSAALHGAPSGSEPSGPYPHADIVTELSFVIGERKATINSIRRERRETESMKAIRIAICEKMVGRTQAGRAMVEAFPDLLEALRPFAECAAHDIGESEDDADTFRNCEHNRAPKITVGDLRRARATLAKASAQ